jgi:hypothetical protein
MATAVPTAVVMLEATDVAVVVMTDCSPAMSLMRRDWISPPRVRLKNADRLALQVGEDVGAQSAHDRWPMVVASQVCTTPRTAVATATPIMPPTVHASSVVSPCGSASSMTARSRKGCARPTSEAATTVSDDDGQRAEVGAEEADDAVPADRRFGELGAVGGSMRAGPRSSGGPISMRFPFLSIY